MDRLNKLYYLCDNYAKILSSLGETNETDSYITYKDEKVELLYYLNRPSISIIANYKRGGASQSVQVALLRDGSIVDIMVDGTEFIKAYASNLDSDLILLSNYDRKDLGFEKYMRTSNKLNILYTAAMSTKNYIINIVYKYFRGENLA